MRWSVRLILFLVVGISLVTYIVVRFQVGEEEQSLRTDLGRRAEVLAESLQESIEPILDEGSLNRLKPIVGRFGNRERLAGVAVYNELEQTLAISSNFKARYNYVPPQNLFAQANVQRRALAVC